MLFRDGNLARQNSTGARKATLLNVPRPPVSRVIRVVLRAGAIRATLHTPDMAANVGRVG